MKSTKMWILSLVTALVSTAHAGGQSGSHSQICGQEVVEQSLEILQNAAILGIKGHSGDSAVQAVADNLKRAALRIRKLRSNCVDHCPNTARARECKSGVMENAREAESDAQLLASGGLTLSELQDNIQAWTVDCPNGQVAGPGNRCYKDISVITIPDPGTQGPGTGGGFDNSIGSSGGVTQ